MTTYKHLVIPGIPGNQGLLEAQIDIWHMRGAQGPRIAVRLFTELDETLNEGRDILYLAYDCLHDALYAAVYTALEAYGVPGELYLAELLEERGVICPCPQDDEGEVETDLADLLAV